MVLNFEKIAEWVKEGKVAVCPTDTVYGLVADATNEKAVKKVFKIKKRPKNKAIPIFVRDIKMAKKFALINKKQEKFLNEVWPGKMTVVLKRKKNCGLPKILFGGKKTIGLRIPKYKLIAKIIAKFKKPLTGTSANISGKPPSTKIKEVLAQFEDKKQKPDLILDAGNLPESLPSTVVDFSTKKPKIIRRGK